MDQKKTDFETWLKNPHLRACQQRGILTLDRFEGITCTNGAKNQAAVARLGKTPTRLESILPLQVRA